jgi:hypothetical protein
MDNLNEFLKEQIERNGFKVNEIVAEKNTLINSILPERKLEAYTLGPSIVHLSSYPKHPELESKWIVIYVSIPNPQPTKPF